MNKDQVKELLLQALETEAGGVQIYTAALECAENEELRQEWAEYLEQTREHEETLRNILAELEIDPEEETPGRQVVRHLGESLLKAMEMAIQSGDRAGAQLVASECVVLAETKDHHNWGLLGEIAQQSKGALAQALKETYEDIEEQEDQHLYHTRGWSRELWMESLGLPAVLPPPEEEKDVKSAIGAERAKKARKKML
ncbi:MAG: hypothetical protein EYC70_04130 [Planctomycetota bacterium]|nr:MAG: hypothetical protein EYC70_04130 [Planctomycetota bacterium]